MNLVDDLCEEVLDGKRRGPLPGLDAVLVEIAERETVVVALPGARDGEVVLLALAALAINLFHVGLPTCLTDVKPFQKGELIAHSPRKLILACFSSSIHRLQQVIELAYAARRKIASTKFPPRDLLPPTP